MKKHPNLFCTTISIILVFGGANVLADSSSLAISNEQSQSVELRGLQGLATWQVSQPNVSSSPSLSCKISDMSHVQRTRWDYNSDPTMDDETANTQIIKLDEKVAKYLQMHDWSDMNLEPHTGIPDPNRCYKKNDMIAQIYKTTGRCSMHTSCSTYDGFAITFYSLSSSSH